MRTPHKPRAQNPATGGGGFTLIEIMMVVGILGMVLAMGMPAFVQSIRKDPLRQAVSDLETACSKAREAAILRGSPMELVIRAEGGQLNVVPARDDSSARTAASEEVLGRPSEESADKATSHSPVFSARLNENVAVRLLYVNLKDQMEAEESRVQFYPNGTSDEFTIILQVGNEMRKISLEVVTALVNVESDPKNFRR
jgi:prepilin-type N-terminal cleavage/methylation domain-containing protein